MIDASAPVSDALRQVVTSDSGRLLVTDGGRVIGLITLSGVTRFIQLKTELEDEEHPAVAVPSLLERRAVFRHSVNENSMTCTGTWVRHYGCP